MIDVITKYFPEITARQREQFAALYDLYVDWNAKINVISRKDITNLYEHHVLHSLAIAKFIRFKDGTNVLDFGTGGGFPGIPLAIMFPNANFKMIDGTGKKDKGGNGSGECYRLGKRASATQTWRGRKGKVRLYRNQEQ